METIAHCYRELIQSLGAKKVKAQFKHGPSQLAALVSDCVWLSDSFLFMAVLYCCASRS